MNMPTLPGVAAAPKRGPGRPKGSTNKRSGDLQKYVEAFYDGLTPGQQAAAVGLVTPKELRDAGGDLVRAMAAKARLLAVELEITPAQAWVLMQKERADLLPYIHQKRAPKEEAEAGDVPTHTYVGIPMEAGTAANQGGGAGEWDTPPDLLDYQGVSPAPAGEVTKPKSQDDA